MVDRSAPVREVPVYPPARTEAFATHSAGLTWRGAGSGVTLDPTPALARGIRVRTFEDGRMRDVDQRYLHYYPARRLLIVIDDAGFQTGQSLEVHYDAAALVDAMAHSHPQLRSLRAKLYVEAVKHDKRFAMYCKIADEGSGPRLVSVDLTLMHYHFFDPREEDIRALLTTLDAMHGCASREMPVPAGPY